MRLQLLDHRDPSVALKIHAVLALAHVQEVELFHPVDSTLVEKTADQIQSSNEHFIGALFGDEMLGSISVGPDDEPGQISITSLSVHPKHQRQGIAKRLLQEAFRLGNGASFSVVTGANNAPALALYSSLGFAAYRHGTMGDELLQMVKLRRAP